MIAENTPAPGYFEGIKVILVEVSTLGVVRYTYLKDEIQPWGEIGMWIGNPNLGVSYDGTFKDFVAKATWKTATSEIEGTGDDQRYLAQLEDYQNDPMKYKFRLRGIDNFGAVIPGKFDTDYSTKATFKIYDCGPVAPEEIDNGTFNPAASTNCTNDLIQAGVQTNEAGVAGILDGNYDLDVSHTYKIVETKAPYGYNKLPGYYLINFDVPSLLEAINNDGSRSKPIIRYYYKGSTDSVSGTAGEYKYLNQVFDSDGNPEWSFDRGDSLPNITSENAANVGVCARDDTGAYPSGAVDVKVTRDDMDAEAEYSLASRISYCTGLANSDQEKLQADGVLWFDVPHAPIPTTGTLSKYIRRYYEMSSNIKIGIESAQFTILQVAKTTGVALKCHEPGKTWQTDLCINADGTAKGADELAEWTGTTDADGKIDFPLLTPGFYLLQETRVPLGYDADDLLWVIEIKTPGTTDGTAPDVKSRILKTSSDNPTENTALHAEQQNLKSYCSIKLTQNITTPGCKPGDASASSFWTTLTTDPAKSGYFEPLDYIITSGNSDIDNQSAATQFGDFLNQIHRMPLTVTDYEAGDTKLDWTDYGKQIPTVVNGVTKPELKATWIIRGVNPVTSPSNGYSDDASWLHGTFNPDEPGSTGAPFAQFQTSAHATQSVADILGDDNIRLDVTRAYSVCMTKAPEGYQIIDETGNAAVKLCYALYFPYWKFGMYSLRIVPLDQSIYATADTINAYIATLNAVLPTDNKYKNIPLTGDIPVCLSDNMDYENDGCIPQLAPTGTGQGVSIDYIPTVIPRTSSPACTPIPDVTNCGKVANPTADDLNWITLNTPVEKHTIDLTFKKTNESAVELAGAHFRIYSASIDGPNKHLYLGARVPDTVHNGCGYIPVDQPDGDPELPVCHGDMNNRPAWVNGLNARKQAYNHDSISEDPSPAIQGLTPGQIYFSNTPAKDVDLSYKSPTQQEMFATGVYVIKELSAPADHIRNSICRIVFVKSDTEVYYTDIPDTSDECSNGDGDGQINASGGTSTNHLSLTNNVLGQTIDANIDTLDATNFDSRGWRSATITAKTYASGGVADTLNKQIAVATLGEFVDKDAHFKLDISKSSSKTAAQLAGAEFKLSTSTDPTITTTPQEVLQTDATGKLNFNISLNLNQNYYLHETKAPSGYFAPSGYYQIRYMRPGVMPIPETSPNQCTWSPTQQAFIQAQYSTTLAGFNATSWIPASDDINAELDLSGVEPRCPIVSTVAFVNTSTNTATVLESGTTSVNGVSYTHISTRPDLQASVETPGTTSLELKNAPLPFSVLLYKFDASATEHIVKLAGAEFTLTSSSNYGKVQPIDEPGYTICRGKTDADGFLRFDSEAEFNCFGPTFNPTLTNQQNLEAGAGTKLGPNYYILEETQPPNQFLYASKKYMVKLFHDDAWYTPFVQDNYDYEANVAALAKVACPNYKTDKECLSYSNWHWLPANEKALGNGDKYYSIDTWTDPTDNRILNIPNVPGYKLDLTKTIAHTGAKLGDAKLVSKSEWDNAQYTQGAAGFAKDKSKWDNIRGATDPELTQKDAVFTFCKITTLQNASFNPAGTCNANSPYTTFKEGYIFSAAEYVAAVGFVAARIDTVYYRLEEVVVPRGYLKSVNDIYYIASSKSSGEGGASGQPVLWPFVKARDAAGNWTPAQDRALTADEAAALLGGLPTDYAQFKPENATPVTLPMQCDYFTSGSDACDEDVQGWKLAAFNMPNMIENFELGLTKLDAATMRSIAGVDDDSKAEFKIEVYDPALHAQGWKDFYPEDYTGPTTGTQYIWSTNADGEISFTDLSGAPVQFDISKLYRISEVKAPDNFRRSFDPIIIDHTASSSAGLPIARIYSCPASAALTPSQYPYLAVYNYAMCRELTQGNGDYTQTTLNGDTDRTNVTLAWRDPYPAVTLKIDKTDDITKAKMQNVHFTLTRLDPATGAEMADAIAGDFDPVHPDAIYCKTTTNANGEIIFGEIDPATGLSKNCYDGTDADTHAEVRLIPGIYQLHEDVPQGYFSTVTDHFVHLGLDGFAEPYGDSTSVQTSANGATSNTASWYAPLKTWNTDEDTTYPSLARNYLTTTLSLSARNGNGAVANSWSNDVYSNATLALANEPAFLIECRPGVDPNCNPDPCPVGGIDPNCNPNPCPENGTYPNCNPDVEDPSAKFDIDMWGLVKRDAETKAVIAQPYGINKADWDAELTYSAGDIQLAARNLDAQSEQALFTICDLGLASASPVLNSSTCTEVINAAGVVNLGTLVLSQSRVYRLQEVRAPQGYVTPADEAIIIKFNPDRTPNITRIKLSDASTIAAISSCPGNGNSASALPSKCLELGEMPVVTGNIFNTPAPFDLRFYKADDDSDFCPGVASYNITDASEGNSGCKVVPGVRFSLWDVTPGRTNALWTDTGKDYNTAGTLAPVEKISGLTVPEGRDQAHRPGLLNYNLQAYNGRLKQGAKGASATYQGGKYTSAAEADGTADYISVSDADGLVEFTGLEAGWYIMQETKAPYVYATDLSFYLFHFTPGLGVDDHTTVRVGSPHINTTPAENCSGPSCTNEPENKQFVSGAVDWEKPETGQPGVTANAPTDEAVICTAEAVAGGAPCSAPNPTTTWPNAMPPSFDNVNIDGVDYSNAANGYGLFKATDDTYPESNFVYLADVMNTKRYVFNLVGNYIQNPNVSNDVNVQYSGTRLDPDGQETGADGKPVISCEHRKDHKADCAAGNTDYPPTDQYGNTDLSISFLYETQDQDAFVNCLSGEASPTQGDIDECRNATKAPQDVSSSKKNQNGWLTSDMPVDDKIDPELETSMKAAQAVLSGYCTFPGGTYCVVNTTGPALAPITTAQLGGLTTGDKIIVEGRLVYAKSGGSKGALLGAMVNGVLINATLGNVLNNSGTLVPMTAADAAAAKTPYHPDGDPAKTAMAPTYFIEGDGTAGTLVYNNAGTDPAVKGALIGAVGDDGQVYQISTTSTFEDANYNQALTAGLAPGLEDANGNPLYIVDDTADPDEIYTYSATGANNKGALVAVDDGGGTPLKATKVAAGGAAGAQTAAAWCDTNSACKAAYEADHPRPKEDMLYSATTMIPGKVYRVSALQWPYGYYTNISGDSYYTVVVCNNKQGDYIIDAETYADGRGTLNPAIYGPHCEKLSQSVVASQALTADSHALDSDSPHIYYHDADELKAGHITSAQFNEGIRILSYDTNGQPIPYNVDTGYWKKFYPDYIWDDFSWADTGEVLFGRGVLGVSVWALPHCATNYALTTEDPGCSPYWVNKEVDKKDAYVGETLTYTLEVRNSAEDIIPEAYVTDRLPAGVTFLSANVPRGETYYDEDSHAFYWKIGELAGRQSVVATIKARIDSFPASGELVNRVRINNAIPVSPERVPPPGDTDPEDPFKDACTDYTPGADTAYAPKPPECDVTTKEIPEDYRIGKSVDKSEVKPGETLTYTIEFRNLNPSPLKRMLVRDALPPGVEFISAEVPAGTAGFLRDGYYNWSLPEVAPSATLYLRITVKVSDGAKDGDSLTNRIRLHQPPASGCYINGSIDDSIAEIEDCEGTWVPPVDDPTFPFDEYPPIDPDGTLYCQLASSAGVSAADCDATTTVRTNSTTSGSVAATGVWLLLLLLLLFLALITARALRRRRRRRRT
jgi:uncharacterized repeat protein (TIGR01451 family)